MGSKKSTTTQNATTVTTPTNAAWVNDFGQQFGSKVNGLLSQDPNQYVAPASTLQNQAFTSAGLLGSTWQDSLNKATNAATGLLTPTAHTATLPAAPTVSTYGAAAGPVATARTSGPATAYGYTPSLLGTATQIAPTSTASASLVRDLLSGSSLGGYENPFLNSVVDSTLADFDVDAGKKVAAAKAYSAANGSAGGSGNAIYMASLAGDLARGRATTESGLRSTAYDKAAALATTDAGNLTQTSQFNASQENARAQAQAELEQAQRTGDQNAINAARDKLAAAQNTSALDFASRSDVNSRANADSRNTATQSLLGRTDAANQYGATANNTASNLLFGTAADLGKFNATQQDGADARALQASGLLGTLATTGDTLGTNDVNTLLNAGGQQRTIDADQRTAGLNLMQLIQQLGGYSPTLFAGKTGTSNSTTTTKDTPSILDQIGQAVDIGSQLFSLGTGIAGKFNTLGKVGGK